MCHPDQDRTSSASSAHQDPHPDVPHQDVGVGSQCDSQAHLLNTRMDVFSSQKAKKQHRYSVCADDAGMRVRHTHASMGSQVHGI